jgi:hypothetical protein
LNPGGSALRKSFHLIHGRHGGVAREGREQRPVRPTQFHRVIWFGSGKESVNKPASKSISTSDAIDDV